MTFPYPLTPEVRADLWRFFGCDDEEAAGLSHHLPEMPHGTTSADGHILDTPFARAFVAWREGRVTPRPTAKRFQCAQCGKPVTVGAYHYCEGGAHIGPDPVDVTARTQTLTPKVTP